MEETTTIRISKRLRRLLKLAAVKKGVSMVKYLEDLLKREV